MSTSSDQGLPLASLKKKNLTTKNQKKIETVLAIDFETYFARDYSLKQKEMTTTKYVRHPNFLVHCAAVQTHRMRRPKLLKGQAAVKSYLQKIDWSKTAIVAHHAHFEAFVLSQQFDMHPVYIFDTLSMSRPVLGYHVKHDLDTVAKHFGLRGKIEDVLDKTKGLRKLPRELMNELAEYCGQDTALMFPLFMKMIDYFPPEELDIIDLTVKMFSDPVLRLDKTMARKALKDEIKQREQLIKASGADETVLGSAEKFAEALRKAGVNPPKKTSPRTGKQTYAFAKTDRAFLDLEKHPKKKVRDLFAARLAVKSSIGVTRAIRLLEHSTPTLPVYLNVYGAHTLRWSGGDKVNLQNLKRGGDLRRAIMAPKHHKLIAADASQIEARVNAYLAGENQLIELFANNGDPYADFASRIYGKTITKEKNPDERFVGKTCILALGYGMGPYKLQHTLAIGQFGPPVFMDIEDCIKIVRLYRSTYFRISQQWRTMDRMLHVMLTSQIAEYQGILEFTRESVVLPDGMDLVYPDLRNSNGNFNYQTLKGRAKIYGALLTENIIQCLARKITATHTWEIGQRWKVVMSTHDELVVAVPNSEVREAKEYIEQTMLHPPQWLAGAPLGTELAVGTRYLK